MGIEKAQSFACHDFTMASYWHYFEEIKRMLQEKIIAEAAQLICMETIFFLNDINITLSFNCWGQD